MKKFLFAVLAVVVVAGVVLAGGSYDQLFLTKMVKNGTTVTDVTAIAGVDSLKVLYKTSDVSKVYLAIAYLATPTATASYSTVDSIGYTAGSRVYKIGFDNQYTGYYGVKFRFTVDSVKTTGSTLEAYRTLEY